MGPGRTKPESNKHGIATMWTNYPQGRALGTGALLVGQQVPSWTDPWLRKLAFGTWNVTTLVGKVPGLLQEVE